MTLAFYMDQHVPRAITVGLRLRGIDVLTAYEDNRSELNDPDLLDRASELNRVLFTQDDDLLVWKPLSVKRKTSFLRSHIRAPTSRAYWHLYS
ncbi:MAG: DUF5615 family PIN-like protein [Chloroflexi bacterium]|nr:DUF5615 family PIN-like protein [Chloroflexota bacterium]